MSTHVSVNHLDDNTALRVLSHLTHRWREEMPKDQQGAVQNLDEATKAVAVFLEANGAALPGSKVAGPGTREANVARARRMLELMLNDESVRQDVSALVANPPDDAQRSVELAVGGAIVLGALVGWLQTKIEIKVKRKSGKTEFEIHVKKDSTGEGILKEIAKQIRALLLA
jgi:hypothetical protein